VKIASQQQKRHVNHRQAVSKPVRQADVGDRAVIGAETFGHDGERAAEAASGED
jgi:hypothetical protein